MNALFIPGPICETLQYFPLCDLILMSASRPITRGEGGSIAVTSSAASATAISGGRASGGGPRRLMNRIFSLLHSSAIMLVFVLSVLTLHGVHAACNVPGICPTDPAIENQIVDAHNAFRRAVQPSAANMLKMIWSNDVAALSQAWLDHCMLKHGPPSSRMLNGYELGENLFYSTSALDWATVITAWHNEVQHYTYPNGSGNGESVGHYTQVVWNSSWQVGCGMTKCGSKYFYGCQYYRAGNYVGWPPYKEGTACDSCPNNCEDKLCTNPCQYINRYLNCPALKKEAGCGNHWVNLWCLAECKCPNEIIPVYRKK
ncbi:cysteine-rich venom protein [Gadus morhua]|uniref:cysteine-rich venom protein n=1 Tax=Gadus morhua TaxID=8049 RepID=UPI0011B43B11|nr:cysteine-rich venom protein-like [Gadus morhua]